MKIVSPDDPIFYVYVLFKWDGTPFYVGKGTSKRINSHLFTSINKRNVRLSIIKKTIAALGDLPRVIVAEGLTEPAAFEVERSLIAAIGRYPQGPLANFTDGGEGTVNVPPESRERGTATRRARGNTRWWLGRTHTAETKEKIRNARLGKKLSPEHCAAMSAANKGRPGKPLTEAAKAKLSADRTGIPKSAEHREKIRAARLADPPEVKAARAARIVAAAKAMTTEQRIAYSKGRVASAETRAKMSASHKGKPKSPEHRAKLAVGLAKGRERMAADPDLKEKRSAAAKRNTLWRDPETAARERALRQTPERRAAVAAGLLRYKENTRMSADEVSGP